MCLIQFCEYADQNFRPLPPRAVSHKIASFASNNCGQLCYAQGAGFGLCAVDQGPSSEMIGSSLPGGLEEAAGTWLVV